MICPKCGKDAGEAKFCPECGTNLNASAEEAKNELPKVKNSKKKFAFKKVYMLAAVGVVVATAAVLGVIAVIFNTKPATYVDWQIIYNDYLENGQTAKEKYGKQKNLFYVRIDEINQYGADVTFFNKNNKNKKLEIPSHEFGHYSRSLGRGVENVTPALDFLNTGVKFKDYSGIHTGGYYLIEGTITSLLLNHSDYEELYTLSVHIDDAKVVEVISE